MRILLIGQAAFGAKVFEALQAQKENVVAVFTPAEQPGQRPDPLKTAAMDAGIEVVQPASYKTEQTFDQYKAFNPDLTVMAFVTDIIPARYFEVPTHGAICYHPSLLPRHRGASAINWAVIMGDTRTGLSIFWPDGGIDTGPMLLQKEIEIGSDDTTGSLYFNHLFPMGVEAIVESIALIKAGKAPKITQDDSLATYEPPCDDQVAGVDWRKPLQEVYNLVRGCDPQPGAYAHINGEKIRLYGASRTDGPADESSTPGTIEKIDEQGIQVAVQGGALLIGKVRSDTGKMTGSEYAAEKGLKVGDRFE
ncbi:MAG: methionyl-tRNA formyltransferase [Deltaproteobacteria bacterium]|jgi:methionyl-tRNA formyltransferase|nr:methionyl-tRNA formyltransferase [Deltaproteobacteria bacterium]